MSDDGDNLSLADLFANASEIEWEGVKYRCRQPSQEEQGRFTKYLDDIDVAFIERQRLPEDRRNALILGVSKRNRWGTDGYQDGLGSPLDAAVLLSYILQAENPSLVTAPEEALRVARGIVTHRLVQFAAVMNARKAAGSDDPKVRARVPEMLTAVGLRPDFLDGSKSASFSSSSTPPTAAPETSPSSAE